MTFKMKEQNSFYKLYKKLEYFYQTKEGQSGNEEVTTARGKAIIPANDFTRES